MKWSEMLKTLNDDDIPADNSDDDDGELMEKMNKNIPEPIIRVESVPHSGVVNRIRTLHGSNVVATWSDQGEVGIYDISSALNELDAPVDQAILNQTTAAGKKKKKKNT